MKPIIKSRWETDAYKLSMGQVFWQRFRGLEARYVFEDRENLPYIKGLAEEIQRQLEMFVNLPPNLDRAEYVKKIWPWMNREYLFWYANHKFDLSQVLVECRNDKLHIVVEGPIEEATYWEIVLLRLASCVYTHLSGRIPNPNWLRDITIRANYFKSNGVSFVEGGGRRPFSADVHLQALEAILPYLKGEKDTGGLMGTSWVEYAFKLHMMQFGTQAHEFGSCMGGVFGHENANRMAMQIWTETYGKRLGYVLPDTYTTDYFLKSFVYGYADIFSGARNDSGNPYVFVDKMTKHWSGFEMDLREKGIIFSNGPDEDSQILALNSYRAGEFPRSFLQGKMWTNNVGFKPYNWVLKLKAVRSSNGIWVATVKIPDDPSKLSGDPDTVKQVIHNLHLSWQ